MSNAVALKLPTFWYSQPEVWFAQAEAQFALRNITVDATKYFYIVAALDQDAATRLLDLITNPPEADKYAALKDRLLRTFGLSERDRATRLLHFRPLGDSKPSALMDEMLALLGNHPPCLLFEQLFLERLPEDIRIQLVDTKIDDHRELARRADSFWSIRGMSSPFPFEGHVNSLQHSRKSVRTKPALPATATSQLCYYHRTFGEAARQCRPPCAWTGNDQVSR